GARRQLCPCNPGDAHEIHGGIEGRATVRASNPSHHSLGRQFVDSRCRPRVTIIATLSNDAARAQFLSAPLQRATILSKAKGSAVMTDAVVAGVGMVPFRKPGDSKAYHEMGAEATRLALADAGLSYDAVQQAYAGYVYGDSTSGQRALYDVGMTGVPIVNV